MSIFTYLTGKRFESLIKYFSESKESINVETSYTYKSSVAFIDGKKIFGPLAPSPVSTVFLTLILMLSFMFPCQTITYLLNLSPPDAALVIYPLLLSITALMVITMRSTMKGELWPVMIYKYIFIVDIILLISSIILSFHSEKKYWVVTIINTGFMAWARLLINSNSFYLLQQHYLHRRLSKLIIKNSSKSNRTKHK